MKLILAKVHKLYNRKIIISTTKTDGILQFRIQKENRNYKVWRRMRAIILIPGMDLDQRSKLCVEVAAIATKLCNIVVVADNKNPYETFYNTKIIANHLLSFCSCM
jgi:hypothetical protein